MHAWSIVERHRMPLADLEMANESSTAAVR
jgi:hypothetical protein